MEAVCKRTRCEAVWRSTGGGGREDLTPHHGDGEY